MYAVVVARAGKSRLAPVLTAAQRHELAVAMARDVLAMCLASPALDGTIVVADALVAAHLAGVELLSDPGEMNAAIKAGIDAACARGATAAIVLPADIPLVSRSDLSALVGAAGTALRAVVLAASRDGAGTNALLLRPPDAIPPSFGEPSLQRHAALARAAGCEPVILRDLALSLDIDTPEDLTTLSAHAAVPQYTASFLASLDHASRRGGCQGAQRT